MTPWVNYVSEIAPLVPECPQPVIAAEVRNAAVRFCEATLSWVETFDDLVIDPAERDVLIGDLIGDDAVLIHINWLGNDLGTIEARTERELDAVLPSWRLQRDVPRYYTILERGDRLWLAPHCAQPLTLTARVTLKPSPTSQGGPDNLYRDYRDGVQGMAVSRLCGFPNKPWTNPKLQIEYLGYYRDTVGKALVKQSRGNTDRRPRPPISWRF